MCDVKKVNVSGTEVGEDWLPGPLGKMKDESKEYKAKMLIREYKVSLRSRNACLSCCVGMQLVIMHHLFQTCLKETEHSHHHEIIN